METQSSLFNEITFLGEMLALFFGAIVFVGGVVCIGYCVAKEYPRWPVFLHGAASLVAFAFVLFGDFELGYKGFMIASPALAAILIIGIFQQRKRNYHKWELSNKEFRAQIRLLDNKNDSL